MKIAAAVILASSFGCEATPNIRSYRACNFTTTPAGYVVSVPEGYDVATVHGWVDSQVERWISDKVTWGCTAYTDDALLGYAHQLPIIVYPGIYVPGDGSGGINGWCMYDVRIEVAERDWGTVVQPVPPPIYLPSLPHELTHVVRGDWHP